MEGRGVGVLMATAADDCGDVNSSRYAPHGERACYLNAKSVCAVSSPPAPPREGNSVLLVWRIC